MKSIKATARKAGILYLLLTIRGYFNLMYVHGAIVPVNATATARNITAAYLTVSFTSIVLPAYSRVLSRVTMPFYLIGELSMIVWLLVKRAKVQPLKAGG